MGIIITNWALESYLKLIYAKSFSRKEFTNVLRPDVLLLKHDYPHHEKFSNGKFWGLATVGGKIVYNGFKMKWHNVGNGRVQLRLAIAILNNKIFLCQAYVKRDEKTDKKEMNRFKIRIQKIKERKFEIKGVL